MRKIRVAQIGIGHDHSARVLQSMRRQPELFQIAGYALTEKEERHIPAPDDIHEGYRMMEAFSQLSICEKVYPTNANFFLTKVTDAQRIYDYLAAEGIIVRNRTRVQLCYNCLRITIGNKSENNELLAALRKY